MQTRQFLPLAALISASCAGGAELPASQHLGACGVSRAGATAPAASGVHRRPEMVRSLQGSNAPGLGPHRIAAELRSARCRRPRGGGTREPWHHALGSVSEFRGRRVRRNQPPVARWRHADPIQLLPSQNRNFGTAALELLSFEIDIWGRLRRETEAARANLLGDRGDPEGCGHHAGQRRGGIVPHAERTGLHARNLPTNSYRHASSLWN